MTVTQWFWQKPAVPGVWEVHTTIATPFARLFSYWNGFTWGYISTNVDAAFELRYIETSASVFNWRGLATKPRGAK